MSGAAHANGDKVYDIATGYWIEAKQEAAAAAGRMRWSVYLYDDEGEFVEKYADGTTFPENQADLWEFAGFDIATSASSATWHIFTMYNHSSVVASSGTSATLKQYFSGEQGYAINADYAVIDVQPLSVEANGTYTASFSKAYSPVTVDVQEQPWQPLEDGYSNFWFELTDDTLSPWLNFSAKNNDAVIDWGDGSGEVALDTLTPTHTYSKAGKYVVKVKGVTGIAAFNPSPSNNAYFPVVVAAELNNEVLTVGQKAFQYCRNLRNISTTSITSFELACMYGCTSLVQIVFPSSTTVIGTNSLFNALYLEDVYVGGNVITMGQSVFRNTLNLKTVHMAATTPPALGAGSFSGSSEDFIIYVPVGYGETYKAAAGWSTYADHILEEGQTPNRAMLSRLAKAVETDTDEDMR